MVSLAAQAGEAPPRAGEAAWLHWASARFAAAAACVQGAACPDGPQGTRPVERADRFGEVVRAADMLARLPAILVELEAHPEGERVRLGLA